MNYKKGGKFALDSCSANHPSTRYQTLLKKGARLCLTLSIVMLLLMNVASQRHTLPHLFSRQAPGALVQATFQLRLLGLSQSQQAHSHRFL